MDTLFFIALIAFMFIGVPLLLPWVIVKLTVRDDDVVPDQWNNSGGGSSVVPPQGVKGRELAWRNKRWDSLEHFNRVQRRWSIGAGVIVLGGAGLGILAAVALPALYR